MESRSSRAGPQGRLLKPCTVPMVGETIWMNLVVEDVNQLFTEHLRERRRPSWELRWAKRQKRVTPSLEVCVLTISLARSMFVIAF